MSTPEGKIKARLDKVLKQLKAEGLKIKSFPPQAGPYGHAGVHDRILCVYGRFVSVEAKADASCEMTPLQKVFRDEVLDAGGTFFLVYDTETIQQVEAFIRDSSRTKQSPGTESIQPTEHSICDPVSATTYIQRARDRVCTPQAGRNKSAKKSGG